jgi:hypothetical protein
VIYHISTFDDNESNVPLSHADGVQNLASGIANFGNNLVCRYYNLNLCLGLKFNKKYGQNSEMKTTGSATLLHRG